MSYTDILIAVHGIGDQQRSATVRSVATRFAGAKAMQPGGFAPQPLGYFHTDVRDVVKAGPLAPELTGPLKNMGFAEVFWADIPQTVVDEGRTLEEIKAWARTVVARARATFKEAEKRQPGLHGPDFSLAAEVIDEIIETIDVLENLAWITDKAGLMTFDLREVLDEYIGDVQIVTEFTYHRHDIIGRFHRALEQIHAADVEEKAREARATNSPPKPPARLHIVAHSEGTVVAFLGLAHALSAQRVKPASDSKAGARLLRQWRRPPGWVGAVHGFMTIGSPIDKHLLLWERLRTGFNLRKARGFLRAGQIRWRNYYDKGDPIGFELNTARRWLDEQQDEAFDFCNCPACRHDLGFARYPLPGKAHNDYWDDPEVFDHFIGDVVLGKNADRPGDKPGIRWISSSLPYVLSALLLILGTFFLYKNVTAFTHPDLDPLQRYIEFTIGGKFPEVTAATGLRLFCNSLGLAALIAAVTMAARLPRLAFGMRFRAKVIFAAGALLYVLLVDVPSRSAIGFPFGKSMLANWVLAWPGSSFYGHAVHGFLRDFGPTFGVLLAAGFVTWLGRLGNAPTRAHGLTGVAEREHRWLRKGARPLIFTGAAVIGLFVVAQMLFFKPEGHLALSATAAASAVASGKVDPQLAKQLVSVPPPVWPVLLSGAAFLYLWWLATLIFDLAFVWNRYIRGGMALRRLRLWSGIGGNPRPDGGGTNGVETCRRKCREPRRIEIQSTEKWCHTGLQLEAGRSYTITVPPAQTWHDASLEYNAAGGTSSLQWWFRPCLRVKKDAQGHRAEFFTLIGTVGESLKHAFVIGLGPREFTAPVSGELVCFANDCPFAYGNNSGSLLITMTATQAAPGGVVA